MNRSEAISMISAGLASCDDERVMEIADIVQELAAPTPQPLVLTDAERAALEQAREDFRVGRVYSNDRYHTEMNAFVDGLKARHP